MGMSCPSGTASVASPNNPPKARAAAADACGWADDATPAPAAAWRARSRAVPEREQSAIVVVCDAAASKSVMKAAGWAAKGIIPEL